MRDMANFFASMQRQERRKVGPVPRRATDTRKQIRYQRNGMARLSKGVRQSWIIKVTIRSQFEGCALCGAGYVLACDK